MMMERQLPIKSVGGMQERVADAGAPAKIPMKLFVQRTHYLPDLRLVYLNNPKVGCSTIKRALWIAADRMRGVETFAGRSHVRADSPFSKSVADLRADDSFLTFCSATFFSVVRNPYARALSAYLDKIQTPSDPHVWMPFTRRYGIDISARLSFSEFLSVIRSDDPIGVNEHFCPQTVNLLQPIIPIDFVGRLEEMDSTARFLSEKGIPMEEHAPHRTNAAERIASFYGRDEIRAVQRFFSADFEIYGYSEDPTQLAPLRPIKKAGSRDALLKYLRSQRPQPGRLATISKLLRRTLPRRVASTKL
jgi:hypothetical protein